MALRAVTSNGVAITPSSLTVSGTLTGSSGTATAASISPTINQSGTAGYTALDINPTETATGSGTKLLQRWAVSGSTQAQMNAAGTLWLSYVAAIQNIGFTNSIGSANDVTLTRDAADTLALRRDTNAQTFRVYNTYTDGSNYERGFVSWITNAFWIGAEAAGTGTKRALNLSGSGIWVSPLSGSTSTAWFWSTAGHYLAQADNTYDIGASGTNRPRELYLAGGITHGSATLLTTTTALTNGAAAATGTLTNAPTAGDPTKWIPINDNGTTRYIPAW